MLAAGCTGGHIILPIEYVLPDGYRGEFEIVQTKNGGPLPIENGAEVCLIPATGSLHVDTLATFGITTQNLRATRLAVRFQFG